MSNTSEPSSQTRVSFWTRLGAFADRFPAFMLFLLLLLMWFALALSTSKFLTPINMTNLPRQAALNAILAVGETFVIITAGIDLSVGAVVGFSSVMTALLLQNNYPIWATISIVLAFGLCIGLFHAFGVIRLGLPPFIMTLATLTSLRGISLRITHGASISIDNDTFTGFSRGSFLNIPNLFWMVLLIGIPGYIFLNHSRWGRYLFAIGSNKEAARLSGINVNFTTCLAYMLSSFCAAFVGILLAMRIGIGGATQGDGLELQAIASSVIGGTSLFGAVGTIVGPVIGAFILATINNGANFLGLQSYDQLAITGGLIIVIVYLDQLRRRKR